MSGPGPTRSSGVQGHPDREDLPTLKSHTFFTISHHYPWVAVIVVGPTEGPRGSMELKLREPTELLVDPVAHDRAGSFTVTGSRVLRFQLWVIAGLVVVSTIMQLLVLWLGRRPGLELTAWFLYVDSEQTVPALFSTLTLLACAGATGIIGWLVAPSNRRAWRALAVLMVAAGLDEYAALHERLIDPLRRGLAIDSGLFYYAWVVPGAIVAAGLAVAFAGFLRRLPADTRNRYVAAGFLFVAGAIGFEAVNAAYVTRGVSDGMAAIDPDLARSSVLYLVFVTIEETLEMIGATIFLVATVDHLDRHLGRRITVGLPPARSSR